jgi:hypothetical protein
MSSGLDRLARQKSRTSWRWQEALGSPLSCCALNMPDSDRAMHLAGELIGVGCGLLEWADYAPCASVDKMRAENLQAVAGFVAARAQELRS